VRYAPLHNHSEYSALDGLSTCREIAQRCKAIGCECCGLTDHATVAGHLEFAKVMAHEGLKPMFGCELYHGVKTEFGKNERDQAHLVAGALTDEGLRNLWRMVDAASSNFRYVGRVNWDILEKYNEGVFLTSACISSLLSQSIIHNGEPTDVLNRYLNIFGDRFWIEIHTYPGEEHELLNYELVRLASERGVGLVYATDAHFAFPEQYETHDAYVAMSTGDNVLMPVADRKMWHAKALYIQSEDEVRKSLSYLPESAVDEALANTGVIADMVNASIPEVRRHLPAFIPRECPWASKEQQEKPAGELFIDLVEDGLVSRYAGTRNEDAAFDRGLREMEVFLDAGLEHYFLQAWDFCEFCNQNDIRRGPGRGSAAGAIVAYALGITDVDPLHYDLIFERFYNPGRAKGFPDIDNDFPKASRKVVRDYLVERWGEKNVRTIGTTRRLKPKDACDKTCKAMGVSWDEKEAVKKILDGVPDLEILGPDSIGWSRDRDPGKLNDDGSKADKTIYVMDHVGEKILDWLEEQPLARLKVLIPWLDLVDSVCARVSGYGVHPSGVVVADCDLSDELPCSWNSAQKIPVTQFPMDDVDARMFVKQDLLGLRTLDTLTDWEQAVGEDNLDQVLIELGHEEIANFDWSGLDKLEWPEEMWSILEQGFTLGVFQIESGYARQLVKEFRPRSVEDLSIIVALNRPGPIRSGAPDSFIIRRNGGEDDKFDGRKIPILEDVLDVTYGWFLYQEQVIRFFSKIGYDLSDADAVRKMLGKKSPEAMAALRHGTGEWEGKGYMEMAQKAGLSEEDANEIMDMIAEFAKYSFNKSHSVAYAIIAFRTVLGKWRMAQFIMASIRTIGDDPDKARKTAGYIAEGRRVGVDVLPPDVLRSGVDIGVVDSDILFGFSNIKGVGVGSARYLIGLRDRYDVTTPEKLTDAIETENALWAEERDQAKLEGRKFTKKSPKQQLRSNQVAALYQAGGFDNYEEREDSLEKRQTQEKELLGVILTDDCAAIFARNVEAIDECDDYSELDDDRGLTLTLPGTVSQIVPKTTKKEGKAMGIVTIDWEGHEAEFVVFPQDWRAYKFLWKERLPGIFTVNQGARGLVFKSGQKLT
jgi:DNA polymerase-3 subunit alpha